MMTSGTVPIEVGKNVCLIVVVNLFADQEQRVVHDTLFAQESCVSFDRAHDPIPVLLSEQQVQLERVAAHILSGNEITLIIVLRLFYDRAGASFQFLLFSCFWLCFNQFQQLKYILIFQRRSRLQIWAHFLPPIDHTPLQVKTVPDPLLMSYLRCI